MTVDWKEFVFYLKKKRLAKPTIIQYCYQAQKFVSLADPFEQDRDKLFDSIDEFCSSGNKTFSMFAIKQLMLFIGRKKEWRVYYNKSGRFVKPKPRKIQNKTLTVQEIKKLKTTLPFPYSLILAVQYEGALRIGEVLKLTKEDVQFDDQDHAKLSIIMKGGTKQTVTISNEETVNELYHLIEDLPAFEKLFPISDDTVNTYYKRASKECQIKKSISSHWLRHSRAIAIWYATKDVMAVKLCLRHKRLETTYEYLRSCGLLEEEVMSKVPVIWK